MKLWISKNTEVPIRDQIVTQITLAIASGEIEKNERLPSRGELARRFEIHENTVSSAYRILTENGIVEFRKGSGFFAKRIAADQGRKTLDFLAAEFVSRALETGANRSQILDCVRSHVERIDSSSFVLVEEDDDFRAILAHEIRKFTGCRVECVTPDYLNNEGPVDGRLVAMTDEKRKIDTALADCLFLKSRSIPEAMSGETRPGSEALIAVVSGWPTFLTMAETILLAAGLDPASIIARSTKSSGWEKGLAAATMVIADALTAEKFTGDERVKRFRLISDESIDMLNDVSANWGSANNPSG